MGEGTYFEKGEIPEWFFRVSINETRVPPSDFPDFSSAQIAANKNGLSC